MKKKAAPVPAVGQTGQLKNARAAAPAVQPAAPVLSPGPRPGSQAARDAARLATQATFLEIYARVGTILSASQEAQVSRTTVYDWLAKDDDFAARFKVADEEACDRLEQEIRRRAVVGVEEPVYGRGEKGETTVVTTIRKYSDVLLIFLMKAKRPEKYRDYAKLEHVGKDGGPIQERVQFYMPTNGRESTLPKKK